LKVKSKEGGEIGTKCSPFPGNTLGVAGRVLQRSRKGDGLEAAAKTGKLYGRFRDCTTIREFGLVCVKDGGEKIAETSVRMTRRLISPSGWRHAKKTRFLFLISRAEDESGKNG